MPELWGGFIDTLRDTAGHLAKDELKRLVANAKTDADAFIRKQGVKMERYLNQLAAGEISKEEFEGNMQDLRTLTEMQSLKMKVAAKASAQRLCKGIEEVVLNGLMKLL
ncbi:MAG: hypothetical protein LLH30_05010 [Candidatus Manganitrophus sp. SA1]|nr:hypothetical protein [Candidatus Manganitrophus morganii]